MIPFVDLAAQHRALRPELDAVIGAAFDSGRFVLGETVEAFEREFAAYCGVRHAVGVGSGTGALHLALLAAGVGPGHEVVTVPLTFVATVAAICYTGARPVFVDVDPRTFTLDVEALEAAVTPRTRAIVPVHLYGQAADMDPILTVARRHGLAVVEDAAQAHGARYRGRPVGGLGDLGCFSFYPSKNLGACGEGGIVVTSSDEHAEVLRRLRDHGQARKYEHLLIGYNERLDALQAAVLRVKLRHLPEWNRRRQALAALYDSLLQGAGVQTPEVAAGRDHVYHLYVVRSAHREALQRSLAARGVGTGIHYPVPVHLQPAFRSLGHDPGDFPVAEACAQSVLSLPMYPELSPPQVEEVAAAVHAFAPGPTGEPESLTGARDRR